jgi:DNA polymerase III epsilon subunit-like protein
MKLVYFDLETDGLELDCQIIQIGAVAVVDGEIVEEFERKLMFDIGLSDPKALQGNSYREDVWEKEAVPTSLALEHFSNFMRTYGDISRFNPKTKKHFKVADLWGHNSIVFDYPRLKRAYEIFQIFLPANYNPGDTIQVVKTLEVLRDKRFEKHSLSFLAETMGIQHDPNVTHDALYDAKLTYRLHQLLLGAIRDSARQHTFM